MSISYIKFDVNRKTEPYVHQLIESFERNSIHPRINKLHVQSYLKGGSRRAGGLRFLAFPKMLLSFLALNMTVLLFLSF